MVYGFTFVCFVVGQLLAFLGWRIDLSEFRGIMTGVGWVNDGPALLLPADGFSKRQLDVGSSLCFHWAIDLCHAIYCTKHAWAGEPGEKNAIIRTQKNGHLEFEKTRVSHDITPSQVWKMNWNSVFERVYFTFGDFKKVKNEVFEAYAHG